MLKLTPILLAVGYAIAMYYFSAWRLHRELDEKSTPMRDTRLDLLCADMATVLDIPQIKVNIYEIEPINGLAAPDGRIFITRGFFNIDFSGQNALRVAMSMILGRLIPGVGVYLANLLSGLLAARLSRTDEYEADQYASALLTKSGIGTAGQKSLFLKLDGLTGAGGRTLAWMQSHPAPQERIKAIEENEANWAVTPLI